MTNILPALLLSAAGILLPTIARAAPLFIPGATAYSDSGAGALKFHPGKGVTGWRSPEQQVVWYGRVQTGGLTAKVKLKVPEGEKSALTLTIDRTVSARLIPGKAEPVIADFGSFTLTNSGYCRFVLGNANADGIDAGEVLGLELDGPAMEGAHFNLEPRRNAASVHLFYPTPGNAPVTAFYNEVTAVEDPVHTYYMACGFSRGYFGMQVNSLTERRIIFSVWDAGSGGTAMDRSTVPAENHTALLAKGEAVHASVFGNEGTGGHSHLQYLWKKGEPQKFVVTAAPEGASTDYTGYWYHPEQQQWILLARFRAPQDGQHLRGLYSFSENFSGSTGHLFRKALFNNPWIQTAEGKWSPLTEARFSHDGTGKAARLDRFGGVEGGHFFLAHGGFREGFTAYGTRFTRAVQGITPDLKLPLVP